MNLCKNVNEIGCAYLKFLTYCLTNKYIFKMFLVTMKVIFTYSITRTKFMYNSFIM